MTTWLPGGHRHMMGLLPGSLRLCCGGNCGTPSISMNRRSCPWMGGCRSCPQMGSLYLIHVPSARHLTHNEFHSNKKVLTVETSQPKFDGSQKKNSTGLEKNFDRSQKKFDRSWKKLRRVPKKIRWVPKNNYDGSPKKISTGPEKNYGCKFRRAKINFFN